MGNGMFKNLAGQRFGRLTVIERAKNSGGHARWKCLCDCGKETITYTTSLTSGATKSCGCKGKENLDRTTHGGSDTKLYKIWCQMKRRCYDAKHENHSYYGGRGIKICDEWLHDFAAFKQWSTENGYEEGLEIDRINSDEGYSLSNCKWSTRTEQVRNRSNTVFLTYRNERKPLAEWCDIYNINYKSAHTRYRKGWKFERIFNLSS